MKILVLGGYGGFGARIARRLAGAGHDVLVAGRRLDRAERFCAGRAGLAPLALDRDAGLAAALALHRPFALVDAAGPFQSAGYEVALTCIAAGCHYLDIADGRDFVAGIGALDVAAKAASVAVIAGASSVPALSGAVARELAGGMDSVAAVEMAISASNRATAGPSVIRAIFSYIGRPIRLWRGRCWTTGHGWQELRRQDFAVSGTAPLRDRLVALAEVPDLDSLPGRLPGRPAVSFRAGTEFGSQNRALWLASWVVRWFRLGGLAWLAPPVLRLQPLAASLGSDRSAMIVRLFGLAAGSRVERRWTLIAADGHGPEIPALAVPLLIDRLAAGELQPGARDAGNLLALAAFEPEFEALSIRRETVELEQPAALYERVLGAAAFAALPPPLRALHGVLRDGGASGRAVVTSGRNPVARAVAALIGFPAAGEHALHVAFEERDGVETWTRDFSGRCFRSRLEQSGDYLVERFGPLRFGFALDADETGLAMRLRRWWLGPLPLPLALAPQSSAREWAEDGRFQFDVPIALPLVGMVVQYRGWLGCASI